MSRYAWAGALFAATVVALTPPASARKRAPCARAITPASEAEQLKALKAADAQPLPPKPWGKTRWSAPVPEGFVRNDKAPNYLDGDDAGSYRPPASRVAAYVHDKHPYVYARLDVRRDNRRAKESLRQWAWRILRKHEGLVPEYRLSFAEFRQVAVYVALWESADGRHLEYAYVPKAYRKNKASFGSIDAPDRRYLCTSMVEKPAPGTAPSNLAIAGRYVLPGKIFDHIANTPKGAGGEIQLTDALVKLIKTDAMYGAVLDGRRYDTGSPGGWLEANIGYAMKRPALREQVLAMVRSHTSAA